MEELRSTEILIKEIQEDARKKAEKTLVTADEECAAIIAGVESKVRETQKEKTEDYAKKIRQFTQDKNAALPLEKKRYLVSFVGDAVVSAINGYLESLSKEQRLDLLSGLLTGYKPVVDKHSIRAVVFGISVKDAEKLLKDVFGSKAVLGCESVAFETTGALPVEGITVREGIIIETEDGSVRMRATLDEIISELLDINRYELADTLFGGRLPE